MNQTPVYDLAIAMVAVAVATGKIAKERELWLIIGAIVVAALSAGKALFQIRKSKSESGEPSCFETKCHYRGAGACVSIWREDRQFSQPSDGERGRPTPGNYGLQIFRRPGFQGIPAFCFLRVNRIGLSSSYRQTGHWTEW